MFLNKHKKFSQEENGKEKSMNGRQNVVDKEKLQKKLVKY
jgi:hypothetical protein